MGCDAGRPGRGRFAGGGRSLRLGFTGTDAAGRAAVARSPPRRRRDMSALGADLAAAWSDWPASEVEIRVRITQWRSGRTTHSVEVDAATGRRKPRPESVRKAVEALALCEAAGLQLPDAPDGLLPVGVGRVAHSVCMSRQAFTARLRYGLRLRAAGLHEPNVCSGLPPAR